MTNDWLPISTAKKKPLPGARIPPMLLLTNGSGIYIGFWNGDSWDDGDFFDDLGEMTHWMELPPVPQKAEGN